jgi:TolB protein
MSCHEAATTTGSGILAFGSSGDIYVADIDGSHLGKLTSGGGPYSYSREVAWSPDGSRIAFSKSDGLWGAVIYVIDADRTNLTRLSPEGAYDATPAWSPDGRRIAFENRRHNMSGGHIFVMNADGTNRVQLTSNRQPNWSPAWSPDGRRIAYGDLQ